jgi:hypothetical protein
MWGIVTPHPTSLALGHLLLKEKAFRNVKGDRNIMKATGERWERVIVAGGAT